MVKKNKKGDEAPWKLINLIIILFILFIFVYFISQSNIIEIFKNLLPIHTNKSTINETKKETLELPLKCDKIEKKYSLSLKDEEIYKKYENNFFECKEFPSQFFDYQSFISLLFAIAEKETNKFSEKFSEDFILGYGINEKEKYAGIKNQVQYVCDDLTKAFQNNNEVYKDCYNMKEEEKIKCILYVYYVTQHNTEDESRKYIEDVISYYKKWQYFLCTNKKSDTLQKIEIINLINGIYPKLSLREKILLKFKEILLKLKSFFYREGYTALITQIEKVDIKEDMKYSSEKDSKIFLYALDFIGSDTQRENGCNGEECKKFVCAQFVTNVIKKFYSEKQKEFKGSAWVPDLEKILKEEGWEKIYDYEKYGNMKGLSEDVKKRILSPGKIVVVYSKAANSKRHIGISLGYARGNVFIIDDPGSNSNVRVSIWNVGKIMSVYSLPDNKVS